MATLGFWGVLKLVFTLMPEIISIVKTLIVWGESGVDWIATKDRARKWSAAAKKARETGDTSGLEQMFNPSNKP
jgi:hypothetical protein